MRGGDHPGILASFRLSELTPDEIRDATGKLITEMRGKYDEVGKVEKADVSFDNCIGRLIDIEAEQEVWETPLDFAQHAADSKATREASVEASKKLREFGVETSMRKDLFDLVAAFSERGGSEGLTAEQKRFVEREIRSGKRNGLHLDDEKRKEITEIKKKMADLGTQFGSNLSEDTAFVLFDREELAGCTEDLIDSLEKSDGKLKVTTKYPHFFPVTRRCRVPETRRKMNVAFNSRCMKENTPILEELVELRQKHAELLGYSSHAAYILEIRMAKDPKVVSKFLSDLSPKLQPIWLKEKEEMLELKKKECEKYGYEFNDAMDFWDFRYYMNQVEETRYAVDKEKLKEYFPLQTVTKGLLEIYQGLLGLTFTECDNPSAWHEEVKLYRVDDSDTKETLGYFYLDLHPRDGKYGHAAIFSLQPSCKSPFKKGERMVGVCAMMANFSKPTKDKPSLLDHDEVETYFHEFGHVMHMLCARTETARFSGANVERDFVEAPSQMLENWVWEEEPLKKMSGHHKDGSPIPSELLAKLMASRKANAGGFNLRQIILGTFDQRIHNTGKADTQKVFSDTYKEIIDIAPIPGTNMPASFGHMCGYDSQYYGYMWSEVYCHDMYAARFKKEGLLNPAVGKDYRDKILSRGGSMDAMDMLVDFLGRKPNEEAFLVAKGLQ